jgi:uncharacterized protein (UPF0248 family)
MTLIDIAATLEKLPNRPSLFLQEEIVPVHRVIELGEFFLKYELHGAC